MGNFNFVETGIEGLVLIRPRIVSDKRGFFMESYNNKNFLEAGLDIRFVQDNHSKSAKGVLRGLHFQKEHPQGKLVRVTKGRIYDVAVDLRKSAPTFGKYYGFVLSEANRNMLYIPEGFAHGFLSLVDDTEVLYKVTDYWYLGDEDGVIWNDEDIGIEWPYKMLDITEEELVISEKDKKWPTLKELIM